MSLRDLTPCMYRGIIRLPETIASLASPLRGLRLRFYARQHKILYAIARIMLSPVRLSVGRVDHTKTVEVRIMKFSPYGSPIPLVFAGKFRSRNSKGFPLSGGVKQGRGGLNQQFSIFKREYLENGSRYG